MPAFKRWHRYSSLDSRGSYSPLPPQRKELLPRPRSDRDAVGDRVAEQIIQRTGLGICGEPGILEVALDQAATFQRASNTSVSASELVASGKI